MQQIEAWPVSQIQTPGPAYFLSEEELRRELGNAIDRRREADARAKAAKVTGDKAEALMCEKAVFFVCKPRAVIPLITKAPVPA